MRRVPLIALPLVLAASLSGIARGEDTLVLQSGDQRVALIELFTSEGCSSCPPADRWLSRLVARDDLWREVVPVAFHVDYWDYIGWADRFASPANGERQRSYRHQGLTSGVYTPGFVVGGKEWRGWFHGEVLEPRRPGEVGTLTVTARDGEFEATFRPRIVVDGDVVLNVALLGFGISTRVEAGENDGRTLAHDFVVLHHERHPMRTRGAERLSSGPVPTTTSPTKRLALAAWVSPAGSPLPIQAVGGWLP